MNIPVILGLIAFSLILLIGYNIYLQYQEKLAIDNKIAITQQNAIIKEVTELLSNTGNIPLNKPLLIIMLQRIINALAIILNRSPTDEAVREHLDHTTEQLKLIHVNYKSPSEDTFYLPPSEKEMLDMLQKSKKISAIIQSEHTKGKIETETFLAENRRIEIIQLKIHLQNGISKIMKAKALRQTDSASYMITKLLKKLSSVSNPDKYLLTKKSQLFQIQNEIKMISYENRIQQRQQQEVPELQEQQQEIHELQEQQQEVPEQQEQQHEVPEQQEQQHEVHEQQEQQHEVHELQEQQQETPQLEKAINDEPDKEDIFQNKRSSDFST
ncbi:MAG: DNA repair ATPase [Psychromonas sp.]|nr:DNA repair ATPase [Psychromonas sp.]